MIRFCDKEVYNVKEGEITRSQLLSFFLRNKINRLAVVAVYGADESFIGIITYQSILESTEIEESIYTDTIMISDHFWKEISEFFNGEGGKDNLKKLLTVIDNKGNILGFAYDDHSFGYDAINETLTVLEKGFTLAEKYSRVQMVVITDLNEYAWRCYQLFKQAGFAVCVVGEKWEWFGFRSGEGYLDYPDYAKLYIYAEGTAAIREEKEFGRPYYPNVSSFFRALYDIALINAKNVYQEEIKYLVEKGVSICECNMPTSGELTYKTNDEMKSIALKLEMAEYFESSDRMPEDKKECLYRIFGKQNIIDLKNNSCYDMETIPLGELMGKSTKGVNYRKRIYLIGPCIVYGYGCKEGYTLHAYLQKYAEKFKYQVISIAIANNYVDVWKCISNLPVHEQDIILSINQSLWFSKRKNQCELLDLKPIYESRERGNLFCGMPIHTNVEANRLIAKEIAQQYLLSKMQELSNKRNNSYIQKGELLSRDGIRAVTEYTERMQVGAGGKTGAIVMNGNPFTKGHRYLIEYAARAVDKLYVFVVEENKSYFTFEDRFHMIEQGTKDLPNVVVVPSGEWVLSYKTMPSYFEKEKIQEMKVNAEYDLEIFARYIAPNLGITKRFVGEEPVDAVTRQYNEQMKEILTLFDIEVEEIPRKKIGNDIVSASMVRKCMKENNWEKLVKLVPNSTFEVCKKYFPTC